MTTLSTPNTFTPYTQLIDAAAMNENFTAIEDVVNGNLDTTNLAADAGIKMSQLDLATGGAAFNKSTSGTTTWATGLTTDTQPQIAMTTDAGLKFGPGGATVPDVRLIRSSANVLKLGKAAGETGATLDFNTGSATNISAMSFINGFITTLTPAAIAANRAVSVLDPGGTAKMIFGLNALANHDLVAFNGSAFSAITPSTAGKRLISNGTDFANTLYESTAQTITAAGPLTLAHGLGYVPKQVWYQLTCVTGEANYTAGQIVQSSGVTTGTANQGFSAILDATNLTIRFGSGATTFSLPDATTGAAAALTNANWTIKFFAC